MTSTETGVDQPETGRRLDIGTLVRITAGRRLGRVGSVTWSGVDGSCGCWSVIVRSDFGEWFGKRSEVEVV